MDMYQVCLRTFASLPIIAPLLFKVDAPHGRFNSTNHDASDTTMKNWKVVRLFTTPSLNVNGTIAWILMELPSPITLLLSFNKIYPVTQLLDVSNGSLLGPRVLVGTYLLHYLNRAIISPLRTPSRSPSHIIVPLAAVAFNLLNGFLMGTYLGSLSKLLSTRSVPLHAWFWVGAGGALAGLAANIWHDEVLLNLRKPKETPKSSPPSTPAQLKDDETRPTLRHSSSSNGSGSNENRYSIPFGGLYRFVSYPNYLTEWLEWTMFAIAATSLASSLSRASLSSLGLGPLGKVTPPWLFVAAEVAVMLPRAIRGHRWYQDKFGLRYPPERKAVIPFVL